MAVYLEGALDVKRATTRLFWNFNEIFITKLLSILIIRKKNASLSK